MTAPTPFNPYAAPTAPVTDAPVAESPVAESPADGQAYLVLFALWLLVFSSSSQGMIVSPILPVIGRELNVPFGNLGWLTTSYSVMAGLCALVAGPISDRIGRRPILLAGTGAMAVALALHGLADSFWALLGFRALAGAAGGVLTGVAVAYIGDYFPYSRRGWASGWVMSGSAAGQILGIPLGTYLAGGFGFRAPFLGFAVSMVLTFLLIYFRVPQPRQPRVEGRLTVGDVLRSYWTMLQDPAIRSAAAAYFTMFLSLSLFIVFLPTWLTETFHVSGGRIATLFLVGGIANVLTGPQAGRLSDRVGRKSLILIACLALAALMAGSTYVLTDFWVAYPLFFLVSVFVSMRLSPFQALLTALVPGERRGALMSLTVALGQVGLGLGGALAGPIYEHVGFRSNTIIAALSVLAMAWIVWQRLPEPKGER